MTDSALLDLARWLGLDLRWTLSNEWLWLDAYGHDWMHRVAVIPGSYEFSEAAMRDVLLTCVGPEVGIA